MTGHKPRWPIIAILVVALLLRAALVFGTPHYVPRIDPRDYDRLATSIADGHGYGTTNLAKPGTPAALWPPGYPYLLAGLYVVRGDHSWNAGRLLGALLGTVTVLLIYLLAREVAGPRTALLAAAIATCFPPLIMLNASLVSEALFVPLELGSVLAVIAYRRDPTRLRWAVLCGALCGLAALTRSVGVLLLVPAAIGMWGARPAPRARLIGPVIAAVLAAVVISPWTVRNARAFHAFVPISTQGGLTAAGTYNSETNTAGRFYAVWRPPYLVKQFTPLLPRFNEAQLDDRLGSAARHYAIDHPSYVLAVTGLDVLRTLDIGPGHAGVTNASYTELGVPHGLWQLTTFGEWAIVGLAAFGLLARRGAAQLRHRFIWLVPILTYLTSIAITSGNVQRYRAPADPFLVLLAAVGTYQAVRWAYRRRSPDGRRGAGPGCSPPAPR
jgi:4-amino-4-deoxy-L-arabinose transferase-like glycosyltransferase